MKRQNFASGEDLPHKGYVFPEIEIGQIWKITKPAEGEVTFRQGWVVFISGPSLPSSNRWEIIMFNPSEVASISDHVKTLVERNGDYFVSSKQIYDYCSLVA